MSVEIKWTIPDTETGEKRWILAEKFGGQWHFKMRRFRRDIWAKFDAPTREVWEYILDSLERRYRRREGVSDEDIKQVERILKEWKEPRVFDDELPDEKRP